MGAHFVVICFMILLNMFFFLWAVYQIVPYGTAGIQPSQM